MHGVEHERIIKLYKAGRLTEKGVMKAVSLNLITEEKAEEILHSTVAADNSMSKIEASVMNHKAGD